MLGLVCSEDIAKTVRDEVQASVLVNKSNFRQITHDICR